MANVNVSCFSVPPSASAFFPIFSTNDADNTLNALISAGANAPVVTVHYGPYMN